ncbi:two-component sensor protein histidine protein kinase [Dorcoceras hygrometricum]|uniref:Two-component sensor protein histidine protein kinase n=1 Tax=Dorcoceras hygrometricum TaxID=472368 RepID=A0A2Z7BUN8_9LAMI|nr:two-component sensor protein histidine protein kinase [Dorcoceras hygrometricum]
MHSNNWFIEALDWMSCFLRLVVQLVVTICLQLVLQSLVSNACDWTSHDWVDQTMSYQLIQTTSFAMHPRLIEYTSLLLRLDEQATC